MMLARTIPRFPMPFISVRNMFNADSAMVRYIDHSIYTQQFYDEMSEDSHWKRWFSDLMTEINLNYATIILYVLRWNHIIKCYVWDILTCNTSTKFFERIVFYSSTQESFRLDSLSCTFRQKSCWKKLLKVQLPANRDYHVEYTSVLLEYR